jgi:hypothetical protein
MSQITTQIKNLSAPRMLPYILPHGRHADTHEVIEVVGDLGMQLRLSSSPLLELMTTEEANGLISIVMSFGGRRIADAGAPVDANDVATRQFVLDNAGSGGGSPGANAFALWDSATTFSAGMVVLYNSKVYGCLASNTDSPPDANPDFWEDLRGSDGSPGTDGSPGADGVAGAGVFGSWDYWSYYTPGMIVVFGGMLYGCLNGNGGFQPDLYTGFYWENLQGSVGPPGPAGSGGDSAAPFATGMSSLTSGQVTIPAPSMHAIAWAWYNSLSPYHLIFTDSGANAYYVYGVSPTGVNDNGADGISFTWSAV